MNATTVKIRKSTKSALDEVKKEKESYDEVIGRLLSQAKDSGLKRELINSYKQVGKDGLRILQEWDSASSEIDDE